MACGQRKDLRGRQRDGALCRQALMVQRAPQMGLWGLIKGGARDATAPSAAGGGSRHAAIGAQAAQAATIAHRHCGSWLLTPCAGWLAGGGCTAGALMSSRSNGVPLQCRLVCRVGSCLLRCRTGTGRRGPTPHLQRITQQRHAGLHGMAWHGEQARERLCCRPQSCSPATVCAARLGCRGTACTGPSSSCSCPQAAA